MKTTPHFGYGCGSLEKRSGGNTPKRTDISWANGRNLTLQKWKTGLYLLNLGITVPRRAAFHDVADINLAAIQPDGLNNFRQKLAGGTDKRFTLTILIIARAFSDKHQLRSGIAGSENDRSAALSQPAAAAITEIPADLIKCFEE